MEHVECMAAMQNAKKNCRKILWAQITAGRQAVKGARVKINVKKQYVEVPLKAEHGRMEFEIGRC
jgi:DNA-binding FrmR family transcriptional regulator